MKRILYILALATLTSCTSLIATTATASMSISPASIREETRFLTDKMAYELRLSNRQYNDLYEINYDFIYAVSDLMEDVVYGYEWALEAYYEALDRRNDDLRWVLSDSQYRRFIRADYFYRPLYVSDGRYWSYRIYSYYPDRTVFYYDVPHHYSTYNGGNYRRYYNGVSYYRNRHTEIRHYSSPYSVRSSRRYNSYRSSDFGTIRFRANSNVRPENHRSMRRDDVNYNTRSRSYDSYQQRDRDYNRYNNSSSTRSYNTPNTRENSRTREYNSYSRDNTRTVPRSESTRSREDSRNSYSTAEPTRSRRGESTSTPVRSETRSVESRPTTRENVDRSSETRSSRRSEGATRSSSSEQPERGSSRSRR